MIKSIMESIFLNESLKSAKEFAATQNIPQEIFDKFNALDTTSTKKLIHQILKWYKNKTDIIDNIDDIKKKIDTFIKFSGGRIKDPIEKFKSIEEFNTFITPFLDVETKAQKKDKLAGQYRKVFENNKVLVVIPFTHKASCIYGAKTKWCTTAKISMHFHSYQDQGYSIYYVINKQSVDEKEEFHKVAVVVNKEGSIVQCYNVQDVNKKDEIIEFLKQSGVDLSIFKVAKDDEFYIESRLKRYTDVEHLVVTSFNWNDYIAIDKRGILDQAFPKLKVITFRQWEGKIIPKVPTSVKDVWIQLPYNQISNLKNINNSDIKLFIDISGGSHMRELTNCENISVTVMLRGYADFYDNNPVKIKSFMKSNFKTAHIDTTGAYIPDGWVARPATQLAKKLYKLRNKTTEYTFSDKDAATVSPKKVVKKSTTLKKKK